MSKIFVRECPDCRTLNHTDDQSGKTPCDGCVEKSARRIAPAFSAKTEAPAESAPSPDAEADAKKRSAKS
jgi:hypothetical protein